MSSELPDYAVRNRELWTETNAEFTNAQARDAWASTDFSWGVFGIPEATLRVFDDLAGKDVVELGCGTAYVSAWLARQGARPVGVDPTPAQLDTARAMQAEFAIRFPLVEAVAEDVPLPDASFDLAVSEYGASLWADPERWVPEAARLLRPGGQLIFLTNSVLVVLCWPDEGLPGDRLLRSQFELGRLTWSDGGTEFHLGHGEWIALLRRNGFEIDALLELQAPPDAQDHTYYEAAGAEWARRWPAEEIWKARKRSG